MTEKTTPWAAAAGTAAPGTVTGAGTPGAGTRGPGRPGAGTPGAGTLPPQDRAARDTHDQVTVRLPAEGAYLSVLRTATAGLAARLDFTLDEIEDLRIAVDEACAMLLSQANEGSSLQCDFTLGRDTMTIAVSAQSRLGEPPAKDTFAWTVLSALAGSVDSAVGPGDTVTIVLRKSRGQTGLG